MRTEDIGTGLCILHSFTSYGLNSSETAEKGEKYDSKINRRSNRKNTSHEVG